MQIQKIKLISILMLCLSLWITFLIVDFVENRNLICADYQGDCCHDGKIELLDKLFCKLYFKQIKYILILFPKNSSRCWEAMVDYTSRDYSEKKSAKGATSKDKEETLYYLDQAIKHNPESIDVLSWKAVLVDCSQSLKYQIKILNLLKSQYDTSLERVPNTYYNIIACKQEVQATDIDFWQKDFKDFCKKHKELNEDCKRFMTYLQK